MPPGPSGLQPPTEAQTFAGQILTNSFVLANWYNGLQFLLNKPIAFLYSSTSSGQSITGESDVNFVNTTVDTYSGHSNSTQPARYYFQVPGWYLVKGTVLTASASNCYIGIGYSSTSGGTASLVVGSKNSSTTTAAGISTNCWAFVQATATGDYCTVRFEASSGSTLSAGPVNVSAMTVTWEHQ